MAMAKSPPLLPPVTVAVIGIPSSQNDGIGSGKSCICDRFLHPGADEYTGEVGGASPFVGVAALFGEWDITFWGVGIAFLRVEQLPFGLDIAFWGMGHHLLKVIDHHLRNVFIIFTFIWEQDSNVEHF